MARMPSAQRRLQLVEAAIAAMTRDGVARTTTRSICAEAGVSLSVFHYCFASKQVLLEAVMETITEHSLSMVRQAVRPRDTLEEAIRGGLHAYWEHVVAHPDEHMLTYELTQFALREPGFEHLARRQYEQYSALLETLIRSQTDAMEIELPAPVEVLTQAISAVSDGLTLRFLVLRDERTAAQALEILTEFAVGLVTDSSTRPSGST